LAAKAFTVRSDITFGTGRYAPDSREGRHTLAHELTHVVQTAGRPPAGRPIDRQAASPTTPKEPTQKGPTTGKISRRFDGVTTYSATSRVSLTASGYKFVRTDGNFDIWVKVDGSSELWLQRPKAPTSPVPQSGGGTPGPKPAPQAPGHPDVDSAREWANDLETRFQQLGEEAKRVMAMRNPVDRSFPAGPNNEYFRRLQRYDNDLKSVLEEEAPLWRQSELTVKERKELEEHIARIRKVQEHPDEMDLTDP